MKLMALNFGLGLLGVVGLAAAVHASVVAPRSMRVQYRTVRFRRLPAAIDGYEIVHLSDFHLGSLASGARHVREVSAMHPDLFVATGDFIEHPKSVRECVDLLAALQARDGVVCVLGNHDHWARRFDRAATRNLVEALAARGIPTLSNEARPIERDGVRLWLAGVDDPYRMRDDGAAALAAVPEDEPVLLLAHSPDVFLRAPAARVDMAFTGHCHGGQIRMPWGPIVTRTRIQLPDVLGLQIVEGTPVNMSGGLGSTVPVRILCPPEVTMITLRPPARPAERVA